MNTLAPLPATTATPPSSRWSRRLAWGWDQASIYLPVLLMGVLALGSYWVVRQTPTAPEPTRERPVSSEPDYTMRDFSLRTFGTDGQLRTELKGREIRHYPLTDTTVVDAARVQDFGPGERLITAQANELWTNGKQTEFRFRGNVRIVQSEQPLTSGSLQSEFQGQSLTLNTLENRLVSQEPVTFSRGQDRLTADRMRYDQRTGEVHFQGQVRATLSAQP